MKKVLIPLILLCIITYTACQGSSGEGEDPAAGLSLIVKNAVPDAAAGTTTIIYTVTNRGKADWRVPQNLSIAAGNEQDGWTDLDLKTEFVPSSTKLPPKADYEEERTVDVLLENGVTYRLSITLENMASGEPATLTVEFTTVE